MNEFDQFINETLTAAQQGEVLKWTNLISFLSSPDKLVGVWHSILQLFETKSRTTAVKEAYRFISGHRTIANMVMKHKKSGEGGEDDVLCREKYIRLVISALLRVAAIGANSSNNLVIHFRELVLELPIDAQVAIIESLCDEAATTTTTTTTVTLNKDGGISQMVNYLFSPEFALEAAGLLLRWAARRCPDHPSTLPGVSIVLSALIRCALDGGCAAQSVIDSLLLRKASDENVARLVVNLLPSGSVVELIDAVSSLWGERLFVSRGDVKMQCFLTNSLLCALERIEGSNLHQSGSSGTPVIISLSTGVSTYLDTSDKRSRICGMRVAKKFSAMMGHDLAFDELEEYDRCQLAYDRFASSTKESIEENKSNSKELKTNEQRDEEEEDARSSDSELEAFDLGEEPINRVSTTNYLRECIEMLQCPDSKPDAHDTHRSALTSIPRIVQASPIDAAELCSPLMRELLYLSNSFNLEGFDQLRATAMHALLTSYPLYTVPVTTAAVDSREMALGARIAAVAALVRAAYQLAALPLPAVEPLALAGADTTRTTKIAATTTITTTTTTTNFPRVSVEPFEELAQQSLGKTTIKRPLRLAAMKKKVTYFRNNFGPVGSLFFYPMLRVVVLLAGSMDGGGGRSEEGGDGIDSLLPTQLLLALGAFTLCSVNTSNLRVFVESTLTAAIAFRASSALSVRRAALSAIHSAIDAWKHQRSQLLQAVDKRGHSGGGALAALSDLAGHAGLSREEGEGDLGAAISAIVDWCVGSVKDEPDRDCRVLKLEVVRIVIEMHNEEEADGL